MGDILKESAIVFIIGTILLTSGCVSHSAISSPQTTSGVAYNQPAVDVTTEYPPDPSHWIEIDPIRNLSIGSGSGLDRILFNISGTTNLPVNSLLFVEVYRKDPSSGKDEKDLLWNAVAPVENDGRENNTFFYAENVTKGFYNSTIKAADYRVIVRRYNVSSSTNFTILGKDPLPFIWIRIDPIGKRHHGDIFNITGTTNLPAGSEIIVRNDRYEAENRAFYRCKGDLMCVIECSNAVGERFERRVPVIGSGKENNMWTVTTDTTGWCMNYTYKITALKGEWDNVTPISEVYSFYPE